MISRSLKFICFIHMCLSVGYCSNIAETGWTISEDILYWNGCEQGLGYTNKPADVLTTDDFTENSIVNPSFEWNWGVRLGTGYTRCDSKWTYQAFWTYLKSKAHGHKESNSGAPDFQGIYPVWSMGPDTLEGDYVSSASAHWQLYTNMVDLNAQYNCFCLCNRFNLMPFLGLRGVLLDQKLTAKYAGGSFATGEDVNTLQSYYYGGGPRFGLNGDWCLKRGYGVFGRVAVAPLFGRFHIKQRETYLESVRFHRSSVNHHFVLSTDWEIGLKWTGLVFKGCPCVTLGIAWEGQLFLRANRFYRGNFDFFAKNRDLYMQGVTISAALDF